ncbi:spore germination protein [Cohnella herbarum]|nr:spore germination protein [Cohnella herbarum]
MGLQMSILEQTDVSKTNALLFCGSILVGFSHIDKIYSFYIPDIPARQTEETNIEVSIRGPKDGLVEAIATNYGLIRRRLPVETVAFETRVIGTKTNTKVGLIYDVEKIAPETLQLIRTKLEQLEGQKIEELISATRL